METIPSELLELETNERSSTASNYSSVLSIQNCNEVGNSTLLSEDFEPENEDPLNQYRNQTAETCLQSYLPRSSITNTPQNLSDTNSGLSGNEITSIAPGENKCHIPFMLDKYCEELSFPVLFPTGRFGFQCERDVKLSPVKYVNARLLNYTGRFASNSEYLFLMQYIVEHKKVSDSINIAPKKIRGNTLKVADVRKNTEQLQQMIHNDQAYLFLRQIPGSPPYCQHFQYEVKAMVEQLGLPTWFVTLSCADLHWNDLVEIIAKLSGTPLTTEQIESLTYNDRCKLLNSNPVIVAKHYQFRLETFFTEVLFSSEKPLGNILFYAIRIEFQMRGSPHAHALLWTSDCPVLTAQTKTDFVDYIDKHIQATLPNKHSNKELHDLVWTYQKHSHSKTCRKYKNLQCHFHFGQFFTERTIVAEPLPENLTSEEKLNILTNREQILKKVKSKIDEALDPSKPAYDPNHSILEILAMINVTERDYYNALSISPDSDFRLYLKRSPDSCFINNYFIPGILVFNANIDVQPVFNYVRCIAYMCSYFSKDETECSQALQSAALEARNTNSPVRETLKKVGAAFLTKREISAQECVYRCLPEL